MHSQKQISRDVVAGKEASSLVTIDSNSVTGNRSEVHNRADSIVGPTK